MEAKAAVKAAKAYIEAIFSEEGIDEVGLEEIEFDDARDTWRITIGFRRPHFRRPPATKEKTFSSSFFEDRARWLDRWYKVVLVSNANGAVTGMKDRQLEVVS